MKRTMLEVGRITFLLVIIVLGGCKLAHGSNRKPAAAYAIELDRAMYVPGIPVNIAVDAAELSLTDAPGRLVVEIMHLTDVVATQQRDIAGTKTAVETFTWQPPPEPAGYGIKVSLEKAGEIVASAESAFDVAADWTEQPRYGFVSEYDVFDEKQEAANYRAMNRLHLNGLQFYDWLYRHEQPAPTQPTFVDSMGRTLHVSTIHKKIELARAYGMAPMAYVAIYAASPAFHAQHPEWGVYDNEGNPIDFGDGYLSIMNPSRGSGWDAHLIKQFQDVLAHFDFGGIHIDQYGFPKVAYDARGRTVFLAPAFRTFINDTKAAVVAGFPERSIVSFNSVANWPAAIVATSNYDFNYIEVWPPYSTYGDVELIIQSAYEKSGGKTTVIAAYVDARHEATVLLFDAIIFAHGATHIELGEGTGLLTDPYFPKFVPVDDALWEALVSYYDFIVRYKQWLFAPRHGLAAQDYVLLDGEAAAPRPVPGRVHAILYRAQQQPRHVLSLINLTATDTVEWKAEQPKPRRVESLAVAVTVDYEPSNVWFASPDNESLAAMSIPFTTTKTEDGWVVQFTANVHYWSMAIVE